MEPFSLFLQKGKLSQANNGTYVAQSVSVVLLSRNDTEKAPAGIGLNAIISNEELLESIKRKWKVYEISKSHWQEKLQRTVQMTSDLPPYQLLIDDKPIYTT